MLSKIITEDIKYIIKNIDIKSCEGKSFFVSGANGLLARYIVEVLVYLNEHVLRTKCKVIALCRNKEDAIKKFENYMNKDYFKLIIQNVEDKIVYEDNVDYIIHAASRANTKEFGVNPLGIIRSNSFGTYNLLDFAKSKKVEGFLFFSSGAVYGNTDKATKFIKETDFYPLNPLDIINCYAESKKMGENICFSFYKQHNIPIKIIRIGHTYGPGINLKDGRVFSDFVNSILNNENLIIKSDGNAKRAFCYISDATIAFFLVLFKGMNGEAYNMCNNNYFISISNLAYTLINQTFPEKRLKIIDDIDRENKEIRNNVLGKVSLNIDKLTKLGWEPKIGIIEGFRRTIESFEKN